MSDDDLSWMHEPIEAKLPVLRVAGSRGRPRLAIPLMAKVDITHEQMRRAASLATALGIDAKDSSKVARVFRVLRPHVAGLQAKLPELAIEAMPEHVRPGRRTAWTPALERDFLIFVEFHIASRQGAVESAVKAWKARAEGRSAPAEVTLANKVSKLRAKLDERWRGGVGQLEAEVARAFGDTWAVLSDEERRACVRIEALARDAVEPEAP